MIKLWKVTVNGIGWSAAITFYFRSREKAFCLYNWYSSRGFGVDWPSYAGRFSDLNANDLLSITQNELPEEFSIIHCGR